MIVDRDFIHCASSCLGCLKPIECLHPDFCGPMMHPTERRLIIGCFDCSEAFKQLLAEHAT